MTTKVTVTYDGEVLRPQMTLDLNIDQSFEIDVPMRMVEPAENGWDVLDRLAGTVEGPEDWSEEHDHYIHGTPKRNGMA